MTEQITLPEELNISLGSESRDFAVKGTFAQPVGASVYNILFGAGWLGFTFFMMSFFLGPGFIKGSIESFTSSESANSSDGTGQGYIFFIVFFGIFLSVGLFTFIKGFISLLRRGGYFVGTSSRLVNYRRGKLSSFDWEQFTGNIVVKGNNNKGSIMLVLRTGHVVSGKGGSRFVPDTIYMAGIEGAFDIEQICRRRIKENDPTPVK